MKWFLVSSFVKGSQPGWLFRYAPLTDVVVQAVPAAYDHDRSREAAGVREWIDYLGHAWAAFRVLRTAQGPVGLITTFPQLAVCVCLLKRLSFWRRPLPVIAWMFNLKQPYDGLKGHVARLALKAADRIVVHSRAEVTSYSRWLRLPEDRFLYVPLTAEVPEVVWQDDPGRAPYALALGTANRDYRTLFAALAKTGLPAIVVSGPSAIEGLDVPANVQVRAGLSLAQCHHLASRARVLVIPIADVHAPSGQVTLIEGMMIGCPIVVTRCVGSADYLEDRREGVMVAPGDADALAAALQQLWRDAPWRERLSAAARERALAQYAFPSAARAMAALLSSFSPSGAGRSDTTSAATRPSTSADIG